VIAIAGWVFPGLGYWLIGQRARAITVCIAILGLFTLGVLIAGIRSIDVPGFNDDGERTMVPAIVNNQRGQAWIMLAHPGAEILNKPWYIGQVLAGPITIVCSKISIDMAKPDPGSIYGSAAPKSHVRVAEIGTLYSAVAGMLNLVVIIDAAARAGRPVQMPANGGVA
jgi:hypothetical protein